MLVLLTGAKGFIGTQLLARLCDSGHSVRVITRSTFETDFENVEVVHADLTRPDTNYDSLLAGCSVVLNCAGEIHNENLMRALHVEATGRLIQAANRVACEEQPIHFVQLSSVGAYGPAKGVSRVVTEQTAVNPQGTYEVTKTEGDALVLESRNNDYFSYSILRPSNVFGPSMTNNSLRQLGRIVGKGVFVYIGSAKKDAIATYIHVEDVVSALMLCGFDSRAKGQVFNLSNDCALSDLIDGMADALQVNRPKRSVPEAPLRFFIEIAKRFIRLQITQGRIDALVARTTYPSTKLHDVLGFTPRRQVPVAISELFTGNPSV